MALNEGATIVFSFPFRMADVADDEVERIAKRMQNTKDGHRLLRLLDPEA